MTNKLKQQLISYLLVIIAPLATILIIELTLIILNVAPSQKLIIEHPTNNNYLLPNPNLINKYFPASTQPIVSIESNFFRSEKPNNGIRFVVQGGATAAGFPYGLTASLTGMLQQRLRQTYPESYIEVINTAMPAINSYMVNDLKSQVAKLDVDGVLLYMGHNEYLGLLGVGSSNNFTQIYSLKNLHIKLLNLRIYRLLQKIIVTITGNGIELEQEADSNLIAKLAQAQTIDFKSKTFDRGLSQFRKNLGNLLAYYQQKQIPVFISTVASNLLDQKPFISKQLSNAEEDRLDRYLQVSYSIEHKQRFKKIVNELQSATAHHLFARWLKRNNADANTIQQHLVLANDLDMLRFRAPSTINTIIAEQSQQHNAVLIEYENSLLLHSKTASIGKNLMLDHLHPNTNGYFLLADNFYNQIIQHKKFNNLQANIISTEDSWRWQPLTESEQYLGYLKVLELTSNIPFTNKRYEIKTPDARNLQQQLATKLFNNEINWTQMQNALINNLDNGHKDYTKAMLMRADSQPFNLNYQLQALELLRNSNQNIPHGYLLQRIGWLQNTKK